MLCGLVALFYGSRVKVMGVVRVREGLGAEFLDGH